MTQRLSMILSATLTLSIACAQDEQAAPSQLQAASYALPEGEFKHAQVLAEVDERIAFFSERAAQDPESWMPLESVAGGWSTRSRLTGSLEDLLLADQVLDQAFERAAVGSGPWLSRASVDFSLHRFDLVETSLAALEERALLDDPARAAIAGLRGDVHVQHGELELAQVQLLDADTLDPTSTSASRLAHLAWRRGDYEQAEQWYALGLSRYHGTDPTVTAWFHLQLGIMDLDREDLDGALGHFFDANARVSGHYLIEEHIAEVWNRQGNTAQALGLYLDIIDRTGNPEFMDAVAGIYEVANMHSESDAWVQLASARYEEQLSLAPEASMGHSLKHFVRFGPSARAVELAEANFQIRPNGDARAALIEAYLADGRVGDAVAQADAIAEGSWRTVSTLVTAVSAYEAAGQGEGAACISLKQEICAKSVAHCE